MCYNVKYLTKKKLDYARKIGSSEAEIKELELEFEQILNKWAPGHLISGFAHPELPVIVGASPARATMMPWGLIPQWVKDPITASKIQNQTLNCRIETMHTKPAFRAVAQNNRCIIVLDGFYEHRSRGKIKIPHFIHQANDEPLLVAGLWDEYEKTPRVTMVTTRARGFMTQIHNRSVDAEPRMPMLLTNDGMNLWLDPQLEAQELLNQPKVMEAFPMESLEYYVVRPLSGKQSLGNSPLSSMPAGNLGHEELLF